MSEEMIYPLREDLRGLHPYGAPQLDVPVRLNVNENPYPPSQEVIDDIARAVAQVAGELNRYPDRDFLKLREALSEYLREESHVHIAPDNLWAANGSNEVMSQIFQAFGGPGRVAVSFAPTYSMYHEYARDTNTRWIQGQRNEEFQLDIDAVETTLLSERPSILVLASPNNPTGTALPVDDYQRILHMARNSGPRIDGRSSATIVIIDEAYGEFRREGVPSALEVLPENPHLIVTRTMSKAFAMAGLRLGYMAAARPIIDAIMLVRLPYHLSAVTQATALTALRHRGELLGKVHSLRNDRDRLVTWLRAHGFDALDSDANFVLFGRFEDREAIFNALLERGVLIRVVGPDGWLRVSVGTPEETARFTTALMEVTV